jgi:hypothetical protein
MGPRSCANRLMPKAYTAVWPGPTACDKDLRPNRTGLNARLEAPNLTISASRIRCAPSVESPPYRTLGVAADAGLEIGQCSEHGKTSGGQLATRDPPSRQLRAFAVTHATTASPCWSLTAPRPFLPPQEQLRGRFRPLVYRAGDSRSTEPQLTAVQLLSPGVPDRCSTGES